MICSARAHISLKQVQLLIYRFYDFDCGNEFLVDSSTKILLYMRIATFVYDCGSKLSMSLPESIL